MPDDLRVGDRIEIAFDDAPQETMNAIVTGFESDQQEGFSPEIEDYVACWVDLNESSSTEARSRRALALGTDGRYAIDGRIVTWKRVAGPT